MSFINRLIGNVFPNFWPFSTFKRIREEFEENEENIDVGISPPKRLKTYSAPYIPKTLREVNRPTVTTVRNNTHSSPIKVAFVEYPFQPPNNKSAKTSLAPRWAAVYNLENVTENSMPKRSPSSSSLGNSGRSSVNPVASIDLTGNGSTENLSNGITYVDLTDDDQGSQGRESLRHGTLWKEQGFQNSRTSTRSCYSSFYDVAPVNNSRRRSLKSSKKQSINLVERINFGRLLGSYVEDKKLPSPCAASSLPVDFIDLSKEDDDEEHPATKVGPSHVSTSRSRKSLNLSNHNHVADSSSVSTSTQKGIKTEVMRVNSFQDQIKEKPYTQEEWVENLMKDYKATCQLFAQTREKFQREAKMWDEETTRNIEAHLEEKLSRHLRITEAALPDLPAEPYSPITRPLPELTPEILAKVRNAWLRGPADTLLIEKYSYQVKKGDIATLNNQNWLNDEVINFYVVLIQKRNEALENYPSVHSFSSFFYTSLHSRGYGGVKRWTRKFNIFEKDILILPIHLRVHWCLVVIDLKKKEINYYDSMGNDNNECLRIVSDYLRMEYKNKEQSELDLSDWKISNVKNLPQQMNGSDCGVFACTYAEFASRRAPFDFDQSHMPYFRRRMAYEIITGQLL